MFGRWPWRRTTDRRSQMIAETSAFLTAALSGRIRLPNIPRRRVNAGGYTRLLNRPGARAAVNHWWKLAIHAAEQVEKNIDRN